jgi:hypothetical protein
MSKGEYVSGLTRFIRACREKADIKHKKMKCLVPNLMPRVEFPIILFGVVIRVLKLKTKSDSWRSRRSY